VTVFFFYLAAGMIRRIDCWSAKKQAKIAAVEKCPAGHTGTSLFVTCHFGRQDGSIIFWPFLSSAQQQQEQAAHQADQKGRVIWRPFQSLVATFFTEAHCQHPRAMIHVLIDLASYW
jgi:hypothetical protein